MRYKLLLISCFIQLVNMLSAQEQFTREDYVSTYAELAMKEMVRTGIPASIKLAQGCLESDNGNSRLARDAKNHFGIKCHDWTGRKIHHDDDARNECFRKYRTDLDSYKDHSEFLTTKSRYAELFELNPDDYKGWARGLKKAGYATSRQYADLLIKIIEENELYAYDQMVLSGQFRDVPGPSFPIDVDMSREIYTNNSVEFIITKPGDTPSSLREEFDLYPFEIYRYNNLTRGVSLDSGMVVYLQPKRRKAGKGFDFHTLGEGQDLEDVSQMYAVKLRRLYRMNRMETGEIPEPGTVLWLRRTRPADTAIPVKESEEVPESDDESSEVEFEFEGA